MIYKFSQCFLSVYTHYLWPISPMQCFYGPDSVSTLYYARAQQNNELGFVPSICQKCMMTATKLLALTH